MQTNQSTLSIYPLPAFDDNYIWCLSDVNSAADQITAVIVDPGDAEPVIRELSQRRIELVAILITHHHGDHTGGINDLKSRWPKAKVYAPDNQRINGVDEIVTDGQILQIDGMSHKFDVIAVPGHTRDHIAYYTNGHLFCGDTLFSCGCGRLFEGSPAQMHRSLQRIAALPADTQVYCAHEYTLANIRFAQAVEPSNPALVQFAQWANTQRQQGLPTIPSRLSTELAVNPFLRCAQPNVHQQAERHAGKALIDDEAVFAALRHWKDNF